MMKLAAGFLLLATLVNAHDEGNPVSPDSHVHPEVEKVVRDVAGLQASLKDISKGISGGLEQSQAGLEKQKQELKGDVEAIHASLSKVQETQEKEKARTEKITGQTDALSKDLKALQSNVQDLSSKVGGSEGTLASSLKGQEAAAVAVAQLTQQLKEIREEVSEGRASAKQQESALTSLTTKLAQIEKDLGKTKQTAEGQSGLQAQLEKLSRTQREILHKMSRDRAMEAWQLFTNASETTFTYALRGGEAAAVVGQRLFNDMLGLAGEGVQKGFAAASEQAKGVKVDFDPKEALAAAEALLNKMASWLTALVEQHLVPLGLPSQHVFTVTSMIVTALVGVALVLVLKSLCFFFSLLCGGCCAKKKKNSKRSKKDSKKNK